MSYLVEVNTLFLASTTEEAEEILDSLMEAELAIVCPEDIGRLVECSHCHGSLVNPSEESEERVESQKESQEDAKWAPGSPCAVCTETGHPGQEMPCAREHTSSATIHPDGDWLTGEDRRTYALLTEIKTALDSNGPEEAQALLEARIALLEEFRESQATPE